MIRSVYDPPTDLAGYDPTDGGAAYEHYWFDPDEAVRRLKFFDIAIREFKLEQWQRDVVVTMFAWKRISDDLRRYREAFIFVPRKNGKSTMSAGLALCSLFCDRERRSQLFCAACDLDQARLVFGMISYMVRDFPEMVSACKIIDSQKRVIMGDSLLRAIPADAKGAYGTEPHFVIGDELHTWPNRDLKDALHTGTPSRKQPLEVYITTAGYDFNTICGEVYTHACKVRDRTISDPAFLPVLYEASKDDDWRDEATWKKANPNYGVSVRKDYMAAECAKAIANPAYENTFKREHLNIWTEQRTRWLKLDDWRGCKVSGKPIEDQAQVCFGLDLSTTTDLTALAIAQKTESGEYKVEWRYYIAEDRAAYLEQADRIPYSLWTRQGYVTQTPGRSIDYSFVERDIIQAAEKYDLIHVGFDPYNATDLIQRLENFHGLSCIKLRQGVATLSAPSKELERCVIEGILDHGNNPVAEWNASNCEIELDSNGNYKLTKKNNIGTKKIDGIAALVFAIAAWMTVENMGPSIYETPGQLAL